VETQQIETRQIETQQNLVRRVSTPAAGYRLIGLFLCILPLSLLVVASRLDPSQSGVGTHQQLGLPPCTMLMLFGVRCPSCGMTTSWAYFSQGQFMASATVNLGGFLLAIYSILFALFSLKFSFHGRMPPYAVQKRFAISLLLIVAVTLTNWFFRLVF
jgi:Protein of unknown function (DUF2752)